MQLQIYMSINIYERNCQDYELFLKNENWKSCAINYKLTCKLGNLTCETGSTSA